MKYNILSQIANNNLDEFEKTIFNKKHQTQNKYLNLLLVKSMNKIHLEDDLKYNNKIFLHENKISIVKNKMVKSNKNLINVADCFLNKDKLSVIKIKSSKVSHITNNF